MADAKDEARTKLKYEEQTLEVILKNKALLEGRRAWLMAQAQAAEAELAAAQKSKMLAEATPDRKDDELADAELTKVRAKCAAVEKEAIEVDEDLERAEQMAAEAQNCVVRLRGELNRVHVGSCADELRDRIQRSAEFYFYLLQVVAAHAALTGRGGLHHWEIERVLEKEFEAVLDRRVAMRKVLDDGRQAAARIRAGATVQEVFGDR